MFSQLANGSINIDQAKAALMPHVYHTGSDFTLGTLCSLPDVWHKIVDGVNPIVDVEALGPSAFSINTRIKKTCTNVSCAQHVVSKKVLRSSNTLPLARNSDSTDGRHYLSVQEMYEMNVTQVLRTFRCAVCSEPMYCEGTNYAFPIILYVEIEVIDGDDFNIDSSVVLHGDDLARHHYDIAGVMYHGSGHFMSRFVGVDGLVYEYDGMRREGICKRNVFCSHCRYYSNAKKS